MIRLIAIIAGIGFLFTIVPQAFCQDQKIGYVDLIEAFDEYNKTKDLDEELEEAQEAKQVELDKMVQEVKDLRDELELASEENKQAKQDEIEQKLKGLQEFDRQARTDLRRQRDEMRRDILREINGVVEKYAKDNGYTLIFDGRLLLYGYQDMDLTDEIIEILNKGYRKK